MSDISAVGEEPFEVRPADEDKGLGCFATRDIKAGETVLVTHSQLVWEDVHTADERVDQYLALYATADEETKRAWAGLASSDHEIKDRLEMSLRRRRPDGTFLKDEQRDHFLHLIMALENNCFGIEDEDETPRSGLFIEASRFNHSCDPNVDYTCNWQKRRWVGRATRDIHAGEEMFITYTPIHQPIRERRENMVSWRFICSCNRCRNREDTYTNSLHALSVAAGAQPNPAPASRFRDNYQAEESRLHDRVRFLRRLLDKEKDRPDGKWRRRELIFALWDAAQFYRQWLWFFLDVGGEEDECTRILTVDNTLCREALELAQAAWSATHEMIKFGQSQLQTGLDTWQKAGLGRAPGNEAPGNEAPENEAPGDENEAPADLDLEGDTDVESDKENREATYV
ncbi:hypothetical protein GGR51DRAFT_570789 [Nemania sp. FL0031]|nr:hypothetical protein GGR51DRAFT_570789 [Nemania sp. FL0031]